MTQVETCPVIDVNVAGQMDSAARLRIKTALGIDIGNISTTELAAELGLIQIRRRK